MTILFSLCIAWFDKKLSMKLFNVFYFIEFDIVYINFFKNLIFQYFFSELQNDSKINVVLKPEVMVFFLS